VEPDSCLSISPITQVNQIKFKEKKTTSTKVLAFCLLYTQKMIMGGGVISFCQCRISITLMVLSQVAAAGLSAKHFGNLYSSQFILLDLQNLLYSDSLIYFPWNVFWNETLGRQCLWNFNYGWLDFVLSWLDSWRSLLLFSSRLFISTELPWVWVRVALFSAHFPIDGGSVLLNRSSVSLSGVARKI